MRKQFEWPPKYSDYEAARDCGVTVEQYREDAEAKFAGYRRHSTVPVKKKGQMIASTRKTATPTAAPTTQNEPR